MSRLLRAFTPALLWAALVWFIGGRESVSMVPEIVGIDKVGHFAMYAVLGWLVGRGWAASGSRRGWWVPLLIIFVLAAADEYRQSALPQRSADPADWAADMVGASIGFAVALRKRRRASHT